MPNLFIGDAQNIAFSGNSLQVINSGVITCDTSAAVTGQGTQIIHGAGTIVKGLVTVVNPKTGVALINFGRVAESGQDDIIASYSVTTTAAGTFEIDLDDATVVETAVTEGCYCFGVDATEAGVDEATIVIQLVVAPYTA